MKNLKKVLALVVVFSMMLSTVAFAAFPDVAEDADYANAVNTIAALGIVGGDDQGNFNPDNTITRAEFTKMICEAQAIKGDAAKGATIFTDVAADHWASGYINMAVGQNIINGMGDGTFAPESPVTYEQAIKMIVVALGYEPMAADRGGYPTGYMVVAQSIGVTKGVKAPAQTDAAKRSLIAELIYNALDVPMMEQTGFGSDKTFEIMDGSKNKDRVTLLSSKFDVVKLAGVVTANDKVNILTGSEPAEGKFNFRVYNNFKTTNEDFVFNADEKTAGYAAKNGLLVGDTDVADLLGKKAVIFVQEDGNDYVAIAAIADGASKSVEIALSDIDTGDRTNIANAGKNTIAYFADDAKNSVKLDILDEGTNKLSILWNNVNSATYDLAYLKAAAATRSAKVTLSDWNDDDIYDVIAVEEYKHYVVEDINEATLRINKRFRLDAEEVEYAITIKDVDGNDVAFEDIKIGDVLAVISDNITTPYNPSKYIDIVVLGANVVEGTVTAWDANNASGKKATIGETVYTVSNEYTDGKINIAAEGAFYLDINGNIFDFDGTKASSGNLGIILKVAVATGGVDASVAQVKMLNKDGQVVVYNIAETVKIRNASDEPKPFKRTDNITADNFASGFAGGTVDTDSNPATVVTIGDYLEELFGADATKGAGIAGRVVQYKANANGEITELTPQGVSERFTVTDAAGEYYNANTMKLGAGRFDSNTVVFSLNNDLTKSKVVGVDTLVDDAQYSAIIVEEHDVDEAIAAILYDGGNAIGSSVEGWAVVTGVAKTTANGEEAYNITLVENSIDEEKAILVTEDTLLADEFEDDLGNSVYGSATATSIVGDADFGIGSVLLYTADEAGNAVVIAPIANVVNNEFVAIGSIDLAYGDEYGTGSDKTKFRSGISNADFDKNEVYTTGGTIEIESATNEYRVNNANSRKVMIDVGSYAGGNVVDPEDGKGNAFLARYVDGDVVDVISIDARVSNAAPAAIADFAKATLAIADPAGYAVNVTKKSHNVYDVEIETTAAVAEHGQNGSADPALQGKWVGVKIDAPATAAYAKGTFGGTAYTDNDILTDGFAAFYVNAAAATKTKVATLTFYDASNNALSAEMTLNIDFSDVVVAP